MSTFGHHCLLTTARAMGAHMMRDVTRSRPCWLSHSASLAGGWITVSIKYYYQRSLESPPPSSLSEVNSRYQWPRSCTHGQLLLRSPNLHTQSSLGHDAAPPAEPTFWLTHLSVQGLNPSNLNCLSRRANSMYVCRIIRMLSSSYKSRVSSRLFTDVKSSGGYVSQPGPNLPPRARAWEQARAFCQHM